MEGTLRGKIEGVDFEHTVKLAAHETRVVHFTPDRFPQLGWRIPGCGGRSQVGEQNHIGSN